MRIRCIHWYVPTLVCVDGFQVHDVTDDVVLICDAISSQHVSCLPGDIQRFATAIPLQHGDHLWCCSIRGRIHTLKKTVLILILRAKTRQKEKTHFFSSISLPRARHDCSPMVISVSMSAIFFCISWFLASGTPNWILIGG